MNYTCFFCGASTRENQDICPRHERQLDATNARPLKTRSKGDPDPLLDPSLVDELGYGQ